MSDSFELLKKLVSIDSITPDDKGCQDVITGILEPLGFKTRHIDRNDTRNIWTTWGDEGPLFVFAGHTDVVPPGDLSKWTHPPFEPTIVDGVLYGRGSADMKSGVACFVMAAKKFVEAHPDAKGRIGLLITSDEEGDGKDGTTMVVEKLKEEGVKIDMCIVGEPSSKDKLGDIIKNGRRGSLLGKLIIKGKQGHIAYPHLAINPIHKALVPLAKLVEERWDDGDENFPPTSFQISNIHAGEGTVNVIPGSVEVLFNFRYSARHTDDSLKKRVEDILNSFDLDYDIEWKLSGKPFITGRGPFTDMCSKAVNEVTGTISMLDTGGGTSDGRFIKDIARELVELGPSNATIHKINENVRGEDVENLEKIYLRILEMALL